MSKFKVCRIIELEPLLSRGPTFSKHRNRAQVPPGPRNSSNIGPRNSSNTREHKTQCESGTIIHSSSTMALAALTITLGFYIFPALDIVV
jgi:hypothetical protein